MKKNFEHYNRGFIVIIFLIFAIFLTVQLFITKGEILNDNAALQNNDFFLYFFSGIKAGAGFKDSTFCCTPFLLLLFYVMGILVPEDVIATTAYDMLYIQQSNYLCVFFMLFCILIWAIMILCLNQKMNLLILLCSLFTIPFIQAVHNGGIVFLTLMFLTVYIMNYKSVKRVQQWIAFISLGIAGAISIYPIVFIFLLKDWKKKCSIFSVAVAFTLIGSLLPGSLLYFKNYLMAIWNNWHQIAMLIIIMFVLLIINICYDSMPLWQRYWLVSFLSVFIGESFCKDSYFLLIALFLFKEAYAVDESKWQKIVLVLCEISALALFSPIQEYQTTLIAGTLLLLSIIAVVNHVRIAFRQEKYCA